VLLAALFYFFLRKNGPARSERQWLWAAALGTICIVQVVALEGHERHLYDSRQWQIPTGTAIYSITSPSIGVYGISLSAMTRGGWRLARLNRHDEVELVDSKVDQIAVASGNGIEWVESDDAAATIVSNAATINRIENAEHPALSADGNLLAFIREDHGKGSLWIRDGKTYKESRITGPRFDVYDISFSGERAVLFSGTDTTGGVQLFKYQDDGKIVPLGIGQARFPVLSPDGKWLAYSALKRGTWHLTIRNVQSGTAMPVGTSDCNDFSPTWELDSQTLVYVSDCGRGLWQTAILRRKVIPGS
jgi:hypothetical protein